MTTIVECLPADPAAMSASALQRMTQFNVLGIGLSASPLTYTKTLMNGGSAAMTSGYTDRFVALLTTPIAMAIAVLQANHAGNLMIVLMQASALVLSKPKQLASADAAAMAAIILKFPITTILAAASVTMTAAPLPLNVFKALAVASLRMDAAIDLRMLELAKVTFSMAATAVQAAHPKNLGVAATITAAAAALQVQHAKQLLVVSVGMTALKTDTLHATDLSEADLTAGASAVDGRDTSAAWTAPTDTMAMSRYTLPAGLTGIAAGLAGVLVLDAVGVGIRGGDTDYGAQINSLARTGLMDFKNEKLKNLGDLYLAFSSTKGIAIDVGETSTGVEVTYSYNSPVRTATAVMPMRVQEGRGIESRHRRYTIRNVAGDKLTLRGFRAVLNDMSRRF